MPNVAALTRQTPPRPSVACTVTAAPDTATDLIAVAWDAETYEDGPAETRTEPAVKWTCQPTAWPAVDDPAILILDSQGDGWAIVFATGTPPEGP